MMRTQIAYVQAKWHSNIVSKSLDGFLAALPDADVASFEVPGAFEMPVIAKELAKTGKYDAVVCAAFVVDGGIYRHDFVAQTVVKALMHVGLEKGVPVLSVSLTPHHFQETEFHTKTFEDHFVKKEAEVAAAADQIVHWRRDRSGDNHAGVMFKCMMCGAETRAPSETPPNFCMKAGQSPK
jgi:6,7-dimethyl-8-ribityllumazine synthase